MSSPHLENLKLVQEMGAPKYDGYNPMAPRSHRWMMDVAYPPKFRVYGWILWRTIDRDPKGHSGPIKKRRTWFAHDERVSKGGHLEPKHISEDLGITPANATDELTQLVKEERARIDEKGRISVRGDAPEPRRIKSEDDGEGDEHQEPILFCTEKSPEAYRLIFQSLDKKRRAQYVRLYRTMPEGFAAHLERLDPEPRAQHTWNYLQSAEYKEQFEADAMAAARPFGRKAMDNAMKSCGYVETETRGRKEVERELTVSLKPLIDPEIFSVQNSEPDFVQNWNSILYKGENGSVQKAASLLVSQSNQSDQSEVETAVVENGVPRASSSTPPSAPLTEPPALINGNGANGEEPPPLDGLHDPHPVINSVQQFFRRKLGAKDPLRVQFGNLAASLGIPDVSVCRFLGEKFDRKRTTRYTIHNPGALYQMAVKDLPAWIEQRGREIEADMNWVRNNEPRELAQKAGQR